MFYSENLLDPLNLAQYPTDDNPSLEPVSDLHRVVFYGDSRVADWTLPPAKQKWQYINRGIAAQTSFQVDIRYNYHVTPLTPAIVVLQVGINDLRLISIFPQRRQEIVSNCKKNIRSITEQATKNGSKVILTTIFPVGVAPLANRLNGSDGRIMNAICETNQFIRSLKDENIIVLDTFEILADDLGFAKREYRLDYLHINQTAYADLNRGLIDAIESLN